jgi:hypothetical protein
MKVVCRTVFSIDRMSASIVPASLSIHLQRHRAKLIQVKGTRHALALSFAQAMRDCAAREDKQ